MTEEEYFRKNYPDYCYGDRLLSPYWDFFQDGVEFGERQSEKKVEELEKENAELKEILNIRSCQSCKHRNKSCPNDGSCNHYSKWEGYKNPQLTKAKEIIKNCIHILKHSGTALDWKTVINQAEQFLNGENIILEDAQAENSPFDADEVFNKEMKAYPEEK